MGPAGTDTKTNEGETEREDQNRHSKAAMAHQVVLTAVQEAMIGGAWENYVKLRTVIKNII